MTPMTMLNRGFKYLDTHPNAIDNLNFSPNKDFVIRRLYALPCKGALTNMKLSEALGIYMVECCVGVNPIKLVTARGASFATGLSKRGIIPCVKVYKAREVVLLTLFELFLNTCNNEHVLQCRCVNGDIARLVISQDVEGNAYPDMVLSFDNENTITDLFEYGAGVLDIETETIRHTSKEFWEFDVVAQALYNRLFPNHMYKVHSRLGRAYKEVQEVYKTTVEEQLSHTVEPVKVDNNTLIALAEYQKLLGGYYNGEL